ncbi:MAG TPA: ADP-ribosylation factor-like protein, partial [Polyangiaceae bacterium]|nr:ADP-ribosylation factor-like protein [Polyangiaceae bacterium]
MAFIDDDTRRIVVRVVYDGPAMAGKTTNIRELYDVFRGRRGSEIVMPGHLGERTIFMDWLHVETGLVSGRQLACHFISVPGQRLLERRRKLLLGLADAVVFVCSAERNALEETRQSFSTLRDKLLEREDEIPIIVQHNKQDHPEALSEEFLRDALDLGPEVRVVPARAHEGAGVRETAGIAVRAAAERVRQVVRSRGYGGLDDPHADAHALAERMRQDERVEAFDRASIHPEEMFAGREPDGESFRPPRVRAPVPGLPALPSSDSPSGLIWPADEGRSILRRALASVPELESHEEARRLRYDSGAWSLWVDRMARSHSLEEARASLLRSVRKSAHLGALRFPQMALVLAAEDEAVEGPTTREGQGWFVWRISPGAASIKDTLDHGARSRSPAYLSEQLLGYLG